MAHSEPSLFDVSQYENKTFKLSPYWWELDEADHGWRKRGKKNSASATDAMPQPCDAERIAETLELESNNLIPVPVVAAPESTPTSTEPKLPDIESAPTTPNTPDVESEPTTPSTPDSNSVPTEPTLPELVSESTAPGIPDVHDQFWEEALNFDPSSLSVEDKTQFNTDNECEKEEQDQTPSVSEQINTDNEPLTTCATDERLADIEKATHIRNWCVSALVTMDISSDTFKKAIAHSPESFLARAVAEIELLPGRNETRLERVKQRLRQVRREKHIFNKAHAYIDEAGNDRPDDDAIETTARVVGGQLAHPMPALLMGQVTELACIMPSPPAPIEIDLTTALRSSKEIRLVVTDSMGRQVEKVWRVPQQFVADISSALADGNGTSSVSKPNDTRSVAPLGLCNMAARSLTPHHTPTQADNISRGQAQGRPQHTDSQLTPTLETDRPEDPGNEIVSVSNSINLTNTDNEDKPRQRHRQPKTEVGELSVSKKRRKANTNNEPKVRHLVEEYKPKGHKQTYFRYVYWIGNRRRCKHIRGGNVMNAIAIALMMTIKQAIIQGRTPAEIEKMLAA